MIIAKDFMTHSPLVLKTSDTIRFAVTLFTTNKLSVIPVVDARESILGLVTEISLLKTYIKTKGSHKVDDKVQNHQEMFEPVTSVRDKDDISTVVQAVLRAPYHRVVVLDDGGHLLGVISPKDILSVLNDDGEKSKSMQQELRDLRDQVQEIETIKESIVSKDKKLNNYEQLFDSSQFMLHSVDSSGKIIMANLRLHTVLGYEPNELIGKTLHDLYPQHLWSVVDEGLNKIKTTGHQELVYTVFKKKNGDTIKVEVASQAVQKEHGEFAGVIAHSFGAGCSVLAASEKLQTNKLILIASPCLYDQILFNFTKRIGLNKNAEKIFCTKMENLTGRPVDGMNVAELGKTNRPATLIVHDNEDRDVPVTEAQLLIKAWPDARALITTGLGHVRILRNKHVVEQVVNFIAKS